MIRRHPGRTIHSARLAAFRRGLPGGAIVSDRRLNCLLLAALALGQLPHAAAQPAGQAPDRPNVLIILADDMGWNDASFHGGDIPTPSIDRLAAEGVELDRFYTNPKCTPTRAALLTGRDPLELGLTYATVYPWSPFGVAVSEHFMGESFGSQGYDTAAIGKWHLGHTVPAHHPNSRGLSARR